MNIKEYISTGVLEAYVLGELTEQERAEFDKNLLLYPELRKELLLVEEAHEAFLMQAGVQPRPEVRDRILGDLDKSRSMSGVTPVSAVSSFRFWPYAAAASFAVALMFSYLAFDYRNKWKKTSIELSQLIAENQQIAKNYNQVDQQLNKLQQDVQVLDNPTFRRIVMTGTENAPESSASVYWNDSTQEVYLRIHNMKKLARDNQYQLWAIIDGKPVDVGVFDANVAGLMKMKSISKGAVTFAVTIEPRGGKTSPTLESMQVAGNVTKG